MTVNPTLKLSGSSLTAAASYLTASQTPTANRLQLLAFVNDVGTGTAAAVTAVGNNLTWTPVLTQQAPALRHRLTLFKAKGAAPTSGAITVSAAAGATQRSARWILAEFDGEWADIAAVIIQAVGAAGTDATAEATLAAFANAANATVWVAASSDTGTGSSDGAPLGQVQQTSNTWGRLRFSFYDGNDTTPDSTFAASGQWAAIAIELKALDQDPTGDPPNPWDLTFDVRGTVEDVPPPVDPPPDPVTPSEVESTEGLVVKVRDALLRAVSIPDDLIRFEFIDRAQGVGSWVLTIPATSPSTPFLRAVGAGIVVMQAGVTRFSGPVRRRTETLANGVSVLQVSGPSDAAALAARQAWPEPDSAGPPFATDEYDVRTGPAETLMHAYVSANVGPTAVTARHDTRLVLGPDGAHGATLTYSARYKPLVDVLGELSVASGVDLCFAVVQVDQTLEFTTRQPVDRSAEVKFSAELGNLRGYSYDEVAPDATVVIAAGQGEGTAREVVLAEDTAATADWGRIEAFRDRRDVPTVAELTVAAQSALTEAQAKARLSLQPIDTEMLRYGRDYLVGDRVSVAITVAAPVVQGNVLMGAAGQTMADAFYGDTMGTFGTEVVLAASTVEITDVVREVHVTFGPEGERTVPLVGTDPIPLEPNAGIYRRLAAMQAELDRLNRR